MNARGFGRTALAAALLVLMAWSMAPPAAASMLTEATARSEQPADTGHCDAPVAEIESAEPAGLVGATGLVLTCGYDYRPDFARPPPIAPAADVCDSPAELADPAADGGRVRRASLGSEQPRVAPQSALVDTNALIRGLERGELDALDKALAGRSPTVSFTGAREFLRNGGDSSALRSFLSERGGSIAPITSRSSLTAVDDRLAALNRTLPPGQQRVLRGGDRYIAGSALQNSLPVITRDQRFTRRLGDLGLQAEGF